MPLDIPPIDINLVFHFIDNGGDDFGGLLLSRIALEQVVVLRDLQQELAADPTGADEDETLPFHAFRPFRCNRCVITISDMNEKATDQG